MLGNRGATDGNKVDAFSRQDRRIEPFGRGELHKIRRAFSKRQRNDTKGAIIDA